MLSPDGWPYASARPTDAADPGRFHTLFGRDSLITALQVLPARPDVARATLRALARAQGTRTDPVWDEELGKILHEVRGPPPPGVTRFLGIDWPADGLRYFGTADATSWFLYVLAATGDAALADELRAAWERAGDWLLGALDRGGGLVRWGPRPASGGGLGQQGWRDANTPLNDTGGGILHEDGSVPPPPVADADTQAAAVAGLRALAALSGSAEHARAAAALVERVAGRFGPETMAIDGEDREVRGAGSQLGWLLWAGVPVPGAAERLAEPDVLTGAGLRTLSDRHPRFDPRGYHRGAVWPFDSWLGWGGLRAAGRADAAERVRSGVLAAIERHGGRFPELYAVTPGGIERIPIANQVQAWTVGAVFALRAGWDGRAAALTDANATV